MKTVLPASWTHSLWLTALAWPLGALAQPAPPRPEPPSLRVSAQAEVASALAEAGRQLEAAQAQVAAALAQAGEAGQALATLHLAAAPPVPMTQPPLALPVDAEPPWTEAASGVGVGGSVIQWLGGEPPGNMPHALIVPAGEPDASQVAELREDLAVFSRILGKAAGEERRRGQEMALGIVVSTFPDLRRPDALYLEGYGAVLLLRVPFPLAAPEAPPDEPASDQPADSVWERTRRELFGGPLGGPMPPPPPGVLPRLEWDHLLPGAKPVPYDARRVEKLQRDLIEALQQGTHLRHIKPEEQLVVVVAGASAAPGRVVRLERRLGRGNAVEVRREQEEASAAGPAAQTLVLRVKKADADALAEGQINFDEFRRRVRVRQY